MKTIYSLVFSLFCITAVQAQTKWSLDASHSNINFTVTHMVVSEVDGHFNEFSGEVVSNTDDFNGASVSFKADAKSIDTGNERRDDHLRSEDFFNAEKNPDIKFEGKLKKEGSKYYLIGKFTMNAVTKDVKFDVKFNGSIDSSRGKIAGFKVMGSINRFDYGLKWDRALEAGGLVVGEEVEINCKIELREIK